jgi:hypothetical protein
MPQNILIRESCWQPKLSGSIQATLQQNTITPLSSAMAQGQGLMLMILHTPNAVMVVQNNIMLTNGTFVMMHLFGSMYYMYLLCYIAKFGS